MSELNQNRTLLHDAVPKSSWLGCYKNLDLPVNRSTPLLYAIVQTMEDGNVIHSLVLPEWISDCEKYTLYPRMTQQKSSQPVYWENTKFMNNRNPKSDWLEYELVSYLNPHDLKSFEKINKRLKRLTSGLATTWEESESEKMLGVGKRKKIPSSKLQDAAALVVEKSRRSNPKKVTNTTTENEENNQPSSSIIVHRFESGSPSVGRNNSGNVGGNLPNVPFVRQSDNGSPVLTNITTANAGNNLPFFPFVHPTDDRLWPPYAPNNTTTGNDGNNLPSVPIVHRGLWSPSVPTNSLNWIGIENNMPSIPFVRPTADQGPPSVLTNRSEIDVWSAASFTTPTGNGGIVAVAQDENSHSTTGEGHLRESNLTSLGVAIATSIFTGDEDVQTPTTSGVFRRPWQMTLPSEPYRQDKQHMTIPPTDVYNVSSPPPIEMHQSTPCLIDSSENINLSSSSASSYISTSSNNVSSNRLKRRRLHYSSGSENIPLANSQFEVIQQQLKIIQDQQSALTEISQKVVALTKAVQQSNGNIPVLEEDRARHATIVEKEFDFLPIKDPVQLCNLDVMVGAREKQSISLIFHWAAAFEKSKTINSFLRSIFSQLMEPEVGNIVQWKTRRVANELITGLKCMPNILAIILVTANLWSKANNLPKQDVQDFIDRCKRIRKQDAYTHRGNTKQPVVLSERTNAPRQLKDDIQVLLGKKVAHLEKLIEKYVLV